MKLLSERIRIVLNENADLEGDDGQIGLAKISGASKSVVNQWLSGGIKSLKVAYALGIETKLGYNHLWLMANIGPKYKQSAVSASDLSELSLEVARAFEKMPNDTKPIILRALGLDGTVPPPPDKEKIALPRIEKTTGKKQSFGSA